MGGALFTHPTATDPGLYCPRLLPEIYFTLKAHLTNILSQHFTVVSTPHEAPQKPDHGDVDFLVCGPNVSQPMSLQHVETLKTALGAVRMQSAGFGARSFAVPVAEMDGGNEKAYAQVDLTICPSRERLDWLMLTHSYGDVFQVLGEYGRKSNYRLVIRGSSMRVPATPAEQASRKAIISPVHELFE